MARGNCGTDTTRDEREATNQELIGSWHAAVEDDEKQEILEQIILYNLDLCHSLARRYANRGIDFDDLSQVARLGLMGAVLRYRPGAPNFVAFAVLTITGELKRHFRDHGWTVRPPRRLQELRAQAVAIRSQAEQQRQTTVSTSELSDLLESSVAEVAECENLSSSFRPLSLEAPLGGETPFADRLGMADRDLELLPELLSLREAVSDLSERDQLVLRMRFVDDLTQSEIGARVGVSQMQVSRMINRILDQLREQLDPVGAAA